VPYGLVGAAGLEPTTPGFGVRKNTSQSVADGGRSLQIQQVMDGDLSRGSLGIAPNSESFGAIVVQGHPDARTSGPRLVGPYFTAREVAARLRVCTATVYRLCDSGKLAHVRVSNAVRVGEDDLRAFLRKERRRPCRA
jgi:excisionase family DNA binding protein